MRGERLKQARLIRGFTLDEMKERLDSIGLKLSKQALSNYEKNKRTPPPSTILSMAKVLKIKPAYLLKAPEVKIDWRAYRCQTSLGEKAKEAIKARACDIAEKNMYLKDILFPEEKVNLPEARKVTTPKEAKQVARNLRKHWGLGETSIESVVQTIENKGCVVVEHQQTGVKFDGLSGWINTTIPLLVVNTSVSQDRVRFNLAHELGHLLMICDDVSVKEEEKLAHCFAGEFLVPKSVVEKELGTKRREISWEELAVLKQKYGLSMQAWIYRALNEEVITESYHRKMLIEFSKRGWKKEEPVSFKGNEKTTRLKQMTLRASAENIITTEKAKEICLECAKEMETEKDRIQRILYSPTELLKLPAKTRRKLLSIAISFAEKECPDSLSEGFDPFNEKDLIDG